jgi:hypothetical protein
MDKAMLLEVLTRAIDAASTAKTLAVTYGCHASENAMRDSEAYFIALRQKLEQEGT